MTLTGKISGVYRVLVGSLRESTAWKTSTRGKNIKNGSFRSLMDWSRLD